MQEWVGACSGRVQVQWHGHHAAGPVPVLHLHGHLLNQHPRLPCTTPQASATPTCSLPARWRPAQRSASLLPWAAEACPAAFLAGPACGRHRQAKSRRRRQARSRHRRGRHRRGRHHPSKSLAHRRSWWRAKSCSPWADPTSHSAVPLPPVSLCSPGQQCTATQPPHVDMLTQHSCAQAAGPAGRTAATALPCRPGTPYLRLLTQFLLLHGLASACTGRLCSSLQLAPAASVRRTLARSLLPRSLVSLALLHPLSLPARRAVRRASCHHPFLDPPCPSSLHPNVAHPLHHSLPISLTGITFVWTVSACTGRRDLMPCLARSLPATSPMTPSLT